MKISLRIYTLFLAALFTSCTPANSEQTSISSSSEHTIPVNRQIIWTDCLNREETNYLVFFYSETCSHCHEIMGDVLEFSTENIIKIYFSDINKGGTKIPIATNIDDTLGISDINEFFIAGTPTIVEVNEATVFANVAGKDACLTFLNEQRLNNKNN